MERYLYVVQDSGRLNPDMKYNVLIGLILVSLPSFSQLPVYQSSSLGVRTNTISSVSFQTQGNGVRREKIRITTHEAEGELKGFAPEGTDLMVLPLFGDYQKTVAQLNEDTNFIIECDKSFGKRAEASDFFANVGWQYLEEGKKEDAIRRFNWAYLLDNENVDAYWGLGVIEYQQKHYPSAIRLMKKGLEVAENDNITLMVDLATVYIKCFVSDKHSDDLKSAYDLLELAISIQPEFANAYMQKALAQLANGDIDNAWISFHKGYEIAPQEASREILSELLSRKEDPMGLFKPIK